MLAVSVADWAPVRVPTVAAKEALLAPANTLTEAGVLTTGLLLESVTRVPPAGALLDRLTRQMVVALEFRLFGTQVREVTAMPALSEKVTVREAELSVAVTTAVWLDATELAVAVNTPVTDPAATVTDAGTANDALLLDNETTVPAGGAALEIVAVQADVPEPLNVVGVQESEVMAIPVSDRVAVWEPPFNVAVTTTL